jgi:hypothetical protein
MRTQVIFIIIALLKAQIVLGQSNLEFESVLNISNGDTYTVPVGKVVKLTSVNFTVSNYNIPLTGCYTTQSNTGCGGPCNYYHCQYSAAGYIVIGSLVFNSTSAETSGLGGCSSCPPLSSNLSQFFAKTPLNLFPMAVAKLHPPIMSAVNRKGDNLETIDNPIGLKNNSPIVITP